MFALISVRALALAALNLGLVFSGLVLTADWPVCGSFTCVL